MVTLMQKNRKTADNGCFSLSAGVYQQRRITTREESGKRLKEFSEVKKAEDSEEKRFTENHVLAPYLHNTDVKYRSETITGFAEPSFN